MSVLDKKTELPILVAPPAASEVVSAADRERIDMLSQTITIITVKASPIDGLLRSIEKRVYDNPMGSNGPKTWIFPRQDTDKAVCLQIVETLCKKDPKWKYSRW